MRGGQIGAVARQLHRLFGAGTLAGMTEWQLLHRYLDRGDEDAFGAIVARHGPMVMGVCRRVLGDPRDVEDAFQATFLVLARKGRALGEHDPVGHWLYGVAFRVALRARSAAARRRSLEGSAAPPEAAADDDPARRELGAVIDQELARLPAKYRAPVVLCYIEGLTHEEAARQLGWPVGTVKGRLARAREILKGRLTRRGMAPADGAAAIALIRGTVAAVPASLMVFTIRSTMAVRSAGMVPTTVAALMAGSLTTMFLNKMKTAAAVLVVLSTGAAVLAYQASKDPGDGPKADPGRPDQTRAGTVAPAPRPSEGPGADGLWPALTLQPDPHPGTKAILGALDAPIAMHFPEDTPLEDLLKHVRESTKGPGLPNGIPIYIFPKGLRDANKTLASTVSIDLEDIALKTTLRLALAQLTLYYRVENGLLLIHSWVDEDPETPLSIMQGKADRGELSRAEYKQLIEILEFRREIRQLDEAFREADRSKAALQ